MFNTNALAANVCGVLLGVAIALGVCALGTTVSTDRQAQAQSDDVYALTCEVVKLDYANDIVTVQDFNGNLWEFTDCSDWVIGDSCGMVMNTKGTASIYDDEIVNVKYQGWTLNNWRE